MRKARLLTVLCLVCACADDDAQRPPSSVKPDAGNKVVLDAGKSQPASSLRPALARPPKSGLPDELRPPR